MSEVPARPHPCAVLGYEAGHSSSGATKSRCVNNGDWQTSHETYLAR